MKKPITINKGTNASQVIEKLFQNKISRLIINDADKARGIVTEKDIGNFLLHDKTNRNLEQIYVEEMMSNIRFFNDSATIDECAREMIQNGIGSLIIGSEDGIKGIVTKTDIIRHYSMHHVGERKVVEIKNPGFVSVNTDDPISDVVNYHSTS